MHLHQLGKHVCNHHGSHAAAAPIARVVDPPLRGDATAAAVCERMKLQLSWEARSRLTANVSSEHYLARLIGADLDADARKFLAAALPVRRALWWSVLSIQHALGADADSESMRLAPVVQWIAGPGDAGLVAVRELDKKVKRNSLWGCLYQATYAASGRISPPDRQMIVAPAETSRRLIAAVVYMAAVYRGSLGYRERQRSYLLLGQSLATGPAPWTRRAHLSGNKR